MYVLGFNGGFDLPHERRFVLGQDATHDAAAVLMRDGVVVAAIEEERLTRIKHCAKFPLESIKFCCRMAGIGLQDVDRFAFFTEERFADCYLEQMYLNKPQLEGPRGYRAFFVEKVREATGVAIAPHRLEFVQHHVAHATSAHVWAGLDDCLVAVFDGQGETNSGLIARGARDGLQVLETFPVGLSLGYMYLSTIRLLGYWNGDEYKAMGLAPYGNPRRFSRLFRQCFTLLPDGKYEVDEAAMIAALLRVCSPRRKSQPFSQSHLDVAAGLQETLEVIVLHVLTHYRRLVGHGKLALAGGVAHNCSMNGQLLKSRLFDEIIVHPASYDPGCAMGAAQWVHSKLAPHSGKPSRCSVFLGSNADTGLEQALAEWSDFVSFEKSIDVVGAAAHALADGHILGWVQGRSEFGPRALGARNILADARPAENRERVNRGIKKRETYRPFAPAVTAEAAASYFDLTSCRADHGFMGFAVDVLPEKRALLGAVTHVDGTARVHVVRAEENTRFWELLDRFGRATGVPVLLSTSFNNDAEPIVESAQDAIASFLSMDLDQLVIGDFLIQRRHAGSAAFLTCTAILPRHVTLNSSAAPCADGPADPSFHLSTTASYGFVRPISAPMHEFLGKCDARRSVGECLAGCASGATVHAMMEELRALWAERLVVLRPGRRT